MKRKGRTTRGKHKTAKSERRKRSGRSNAFGPPRSAEALFARPKIFHEQWNRVVQVPSEMRAHGLSLSQASRHLGVPTKTVLRVGGSAFTKKRGRYKVKPMDRLLRVLVIPGKKGLREIAVRDSREASIVGQYWSALEKALTTGDDTAFRKLTRKTVKDENGKRVRLLTNLDELRRQASAGVLHFESLYGRAA